MRGSLPLLRNHIYENHMESLFAELNITESITTENDQVRDAITRRFCEKKSIPEGSKFKCMICSKIFETMVMMYNHMKNHLKYQSSRASCLAPCTMCGKMMKRSRLEQHDCTRDEPTNKSTQRSLTIEGSQVPNSVMTVSNFPMEELVKEVANEQDPDITSISEMQAGDNGTHAFIAEGDVDSAFNSVAKEDVMTLDLHTTFTEKEPTISLRTHAALPSPPPPGQRAPPRSPCTCPGCLVPPCGACAPCVNKARKARCKERVKCVKRIRKVQ